MAVQIGHPRRVRLSYVGFYFRSVRWPKRAGCNLYTQANAGTFRDDSTHVNTNGGPYDDSPTHTKANASPYCNSSTHNIANTGSYCGPYSRAHSRTHCHLSTLTNAHPDRDTDTYAKSDSNTSFTNSSALIGCNGDDRR